MKNPFVFIAALIAAFLSFNLSAFAGKEVEPPPASKPTIVFSSTVESSYMIDGIVFYDGIYIKSDLTAIWDNGLSLNLWWASDLKGGQSGGDEVDYTIAYAKTLGGFNFAASAAYYDLARLGSTDTDVWDFRFSVARTFEYGRHNITPFVEIDYYVPVHPGREVFLEQGWIYEAGLKHGVKITDGLGFNHCAALVYDDGAFANDQGFVATYAASLSYQLTKHLSLSFGGKYYWQISDFQDSRRVTGNRGTASAGFTYTF